MCISYTQEILFFYHHDSIAMYTILFYKFVSTFRRRRRCVYLPRYGNKSIYIELNLNCKHCEPSGMFLFFSWASNYDEEKKFPYCLLLWLLIHFAIIFGYLMAGVKSKNMNWLYFLVIGRACKI